MLVVAAARARGDRGTLGALGRAGAAVPHGRRRRGRDRAHAGDRRAGSLLEAGRIKVYSCDSVAGRAWISKEHPPGATARSCRSGSTVSCGRRWCRRSAPIPARRTLRSSPPALPSVPSTPWPSAGTPDVFTTAIGLSGTYDLEKLLSFQGRAVLPRLAPCCFLPNLPDGPQLGRLRQRFVLLAFGQGRWESPEESWRMADVLGRKGIPNRVDPGATSTTTIGRLGGGCRPHYLGQLAS